jgi:hypothetical protein
MHSDDAARPYPRVMRYDHGERIMAEMHGGIDSGSRRYPRRE